MVMVSVTAIDVMITAIMIEKLIVLVIAILLFL